MQAYEPLAISPGSNGSIYSSGYNAANNANQIQNDLNQSVSGGKRSKRSLKGGADLVGIPVAYNDGGGINNSYANLTELHNQSNADAVGDSLVSKGGTRRSRKSRRSRKRKGIRSRRSRSKKRRSRRHK
jgi:hypothetical protein